MKRICILLLVLSLGFLTVCQPALAISIGPGQSLWALAAAPSSFDGMTLFWAADHWDDGADLDYILYGPTGWTGNPTVANSQAPSIVDLSIFQGEDVVFQFLNKSTGSQVIEFTDSFTYSFFENATPDWEIKNEIQTTRENWLLSPPAHGNQFFFHDLSSVVDTVSGSDVDYPQANIRSDFQAAPVPEPGTLLLLASGIVALAGSRRKFKKK